MLSGQIAALHTKLVLGAKSDKCVPLLPRTGSAVRGLAGKARPSMDDGSAGAGLAVGAVQLMQGGLQVLLKLPVTVAGRDWLRQGEQLPSH